MMKKIIVVALLILAAGCTVTQKESDAMQAATNMSQQAEINSLKQNIETRAYIDIQIGRAMDQIKEMLTLWGAERRPHSPQ